MRRLDTLFARLFGVLVIAIVLGHLLAFAWFHYMGRQPGPSLLPPSHRSRLLPDRRVRHWVSLAGCWADRSPSS